MIPTVKTVDAAVVVYGMFFVVVVIAGVVHTDPVRVRVRVRARARVGVRVRVRVRARTRVRVKG